MVVVAMVAMAAAVAATMNNGTQAFGIAAAAAQAMLSSIANKMRDKCFKYTERQ